MPETTDKTKSTEAPPTPPTPPTAKVKESEVEKVEKKVADKKVALDKATEAAHKAHLELMDAQKELLNVQSKRTE